MIAILYGLLWSRHTDAHYSLLINQELRLRGEELICKLSKLVRLTSLNQNNLLIPLKMTLREHYEEN